MIKLGLDFDNTLITYDSLFKRAAYEKKLISNDFPENKNLIRNYLRERNQENTFTILQGEIYGKRIYEASQSKGMFSALKDAKNVGIKLFIISHKTKTPYLGKKYDLHKAAMAWLEKNLFFEEKGINLPRENVFFEITKEKKIERIERIGCTHYIDDLPEILEMINPKIDRILYNPATHFNSNQEFKCLKEWSNLINLLN